MATYHDIVKHFSSQHKFLRSFRYIQRFFTIVYDTYNFLEQIYIQFAKLISSSELLINSEIEVLIAVNKWVNYDFEKRRNVAKDILFKGIPLLLEGSFNRVTKTKMCLKISFTVLRC